MRSDGVGGLFIPRVVAIDFETTGRLAGYHEPCQIAVVALGPELRPISGVEPFYTLIRPLHLKRAEPEAMRIHGIEPDRLAEAPEPGDVAEGLVGWCRALGAGRRLTPLAHSWPFEWSFLNAWLGFPLHGELFERDARDTRAFALAQNDRDRWAGKPVTYPNISLSGLCKQLGVVNQGAHDALWDAVAEAEVYRRELMS